MRITWRAWGLGVLIGAGLIFSSSVVSANDAPVVHVNAVVKDGAVRLEAQANAPFEYTSYRPSDSLYVLDLTGVTAGDPSGARVVASDVVKSYRLVAYTSANKPVVRVEILLTQGIDPVVERKDNQDLSLLVSRNPVAAITPTSATSASVPPMVPVAVKASTTKAPSSGPDAIRQVHLTQNGAATEVSISGSGPMTYRAVHLRGPDRVVLDFAGSHLKTSEKQIASNLDPIRDVRLAQYAPNTARVVIDLRKNAAYNIRKDDNTVTVSFAAHESTSGLPLMSTETATAAMPKPPAVEPVEIPAPHTALPAALTATSGALARQDGGQIQPQVMSTTANMASQAAAPAADAPSGQDNSNASSPAPAVTAQMPPQAPTPAPSTRYSGEPISVNLKDVDLRDFFRLIHEISGLNVVVDPGVKGNLTIVLDDVPWDQALDIVLRNNDLDKQLDGNILRIATKETLKREAEESRDLAKAQAEAADVITTTRVLSYAKATNLVPTLKKFLSSRGDIIADDRSNTLIIRDIPSTLPVLDNLIRQLDRRSQQVEIEARVVEASRNFSREIGTQFGFAAASNSGNNILGGVSTVGTSPIIRNFPPLPAPPIVVSSGGSGGAGATSGSIPLMTNLGATTPTSGFSYAYSNKNFALDLVITAAEERGVGKLLSKPKIITQNNQKATVKQGDKIPVQTIVNNTVSVQFVDAVLELDVTPQITADGTVYMDVTVENDQIDNGIPRVQGIPAISTQSAETKVTVNDGTTVVIGGIIVTNQQTDIQEVPLLGSVPVLGNLFKHTTVSSQSQELLFFLTPRILPS